MSRVTFCQTRNFVRLNSGPAFIFAAIASLISMPAAVIGYSTLYLPLSAFTLAAYLKAQTGRHVLALNEGAPAERAKNAKALAFAITLKMSILMLLPHAVLSLALWLLPDLLDRGYLFHFATPDAWLLDFLSKRRLSELTGTQIILIATTNQALLLLIIAFVRARHPLLALCNACFESPARYYDPEISLEQQPDITRELTEAASGTLPLLAQFSTTIAGVGFYTTYQSLWTGSQDAHTVVISAYASCILIIVIGLGLTLGLVYISRSCGENYSFPTPRRFKGR